LKQNRPLFMPHPKGIRKKLAHRSLRKKVTEVKRQKYLSNFSEAKTAGVLFYSTHESVFQPVNRFINFLVSNNIEVTPLGFVNDEKMIDPYLYHKGYSFISMKDLSWLKIPRGAAVDKFTHEHFDMLFNLSIDHSFALDYITALSHAKMKIGKLFTPSNYLDVAFDLQHENQLRKEVKREIALEVKQAAKRASRPVDANIDIKVEKEIEINFLIEQIIHYVGSFDHSISFHKPVKH
jgi:hypothetical protein